MRGILATIICGLFVLLLQAVLLLSIDGSPLGLQFDLFVLSHGFSYGLIFGLFGLVFTGWMKSSIYDTWTYAQGTTLGSILLVLILNGIMVTTAESTSDYAFLIAAIYNFTCMIPVAFVPAPPISLIFVGAAVIGGIAGTIGSCVARYLRVKPEQKEESTE